MKPADPLLKTFSAKVYTHSDELVEIAALPPSTPILWSEPVFWQVECRVVVHGRRLLSIVCYARNGDHVRPDRVAFPLTDTERDEALRLVETMLATEQVAFPPAFVVDVGRIAGRGWATIEFNPLWTSRFFGAQSREYLDALMSVTGLPGSKIMRWSIDRSPWAHRPELL